MYEIKQAITVRGAKSTPQPEPTQPIADTDRLRFFIGAAHGKISVVFSARFFTRTKGMDPMPDFPPAHRYSTLPSRSPNCNVASRRNVESDAVRIATPQDLRFIDHLQKKFANAVGFLPKIAIENLTEQGHIRIAIENDEGAGYILSRPSLRWQPKMRSITQACVAMDAQRRHHGLALLDRIVAEAQADGLSAIQACCAVGLDSNEFWRAAGFMPIVHMTPANVRGREIICWRKPLTSKVPIWFSQPPRLAGHRAKRPSFLRNPNRSMDATLIARDFLTSARTQPANIT